MNSLSSSRCLHMVTRRTFITRTAPGAVLAWWGSTVMGFAGDTQPRTRMGLVAYCLNRTLKARPRRGDSSALSLLKSAHAYGAGGIQASLSNHSPDDLHQLREQAAVWDMHVEAILRLPFASSEMESFTRQVRAAREAGARVGRVVMMPGRRYEEFKSMEDFNRFHERGVKALERAEPICARLDFTLAVENHKDHRVEQRLQLLVHLDSAHIGACVDTGNNLALLEDPLEVVNALAPWARTVHIKDQAVQPCPEGFLLSDAALGEGILPLPEMVAVLRRAQPGIRFNLESITRDPLRIPVLKESYWRTLAEVPATDLARTLDRIQTHRAPQALPVISRLSPEEQLAAEQEVVHQSIRYARDVLHI